MDKKLLCAAMLLLLFGATIHAQVSGQPDTSFGSNGRVVTNIGIATYNIKAQSAQPDGKIVIVGDAATGMGVRGFVRRLNANGDMDATFIDGYSELTENTLRAVRVQADGKILIGGQYEIVVRLNADGTVDTDFGTNGMVSGTNETAYIADLLVQPDQKILTLSNYYNLDSGSQDYRLSRLTTAGLPDTTFDTDGTVTTDMGYQDTPRTIALQNDGKIVVGGQCYDNTNPANSRFFATRYTSAGAYDHTFGTAGKRTLGYTGATYTESMGAVIQPDGKIICSGKSVMGTNGVIMYAIRLTSSGAIDSTFGGASGVNFFVEGGITTDDVRPRAKLDANGKLVITDVVDPALNYQRDIVIRRFNSNGTADNSFGTNGAAVIQYYNRNDLAADFSFAGDKILVTGNTEETYWLNRMAFTRLNADGTFDTTFGGDGMYVTTIATNAADEAHTSLMQPDGKLLVGGGTFLNNATRFSIARYNTNGSLDTTFGMGTGKLSLPFYGAVHALAIDSDGKILVGGHEFEMALTRLNPDGSLDTTFGVNGIADLNAIDFAGTINSIAVQSNGKIVIGGSYVDFNNSPTTDDFMLVRFNANGTMDNTFGVNGIASGNSTDAADFITAIRVLPNGKILATGVVNNGSEDDVAVLRYNSNGTADSSFNGNGLSTYGGPGWDWAYDIDIQSDGKPIIAAFINANPQHMGVLRFNTDGSLDTNFGTNGLATIVVNDASYINSIVVSPDNKILAGGASYVGNDIVYSVGRLNADGSLDTGFGTAGTASIAHGQNAVAYAASMEVVGNRILIAGTKYAAANTPPDFTIAAMHLDSNLSVEKVDKTDATFYPNPATEKISFTDGIISASVTDMLGKVVPVTFSSGSIDISRLAAAVYIVNTVNSDGISESRKLVKK